ncbi:MAG: DNA recombination protein RmuC [Fibromonadaceae bacterium]|nr:DNA recombination protein RmuC [Fibromonadaceae bacterium]
MNLGIIIFITVGFLATIAVVIVFTRKKGNGDLIIALTAEKTRLNTLYEVAEQQRKEAETAKNLAEQKVEEKQNKINEIEKENSRLLANLKSCEEKLENQAIEIKTLHENTKNEFKNIANEILTTNTKIFNENNSNKLSEILKPFSDNLGEFKKKVEETYEKEARDRTSLEQQVKDLLAQTTKVSEQANNLTTVLKVDKKQQGNWGEKILETILEKSGLVKNTHYELQSTNTEGKRPDAIVHLPDNRVIIIDSKVSLINYTYYSEASETKDRNKYLNDYKKDVDDQIKNLNSKNYDKTMSDKSLDFMVMLFPVEAAYLTLIQEFSGLWNEAYEKRILLVSPTNLIACLKLIESLWRRDGFSKKAQEIVRVGESIYEKFVGFAKDIEDIGKSIDKSKDSYDEAVKKLSSGKGNLIKLTENLKNLGIKSDKQIPNTLLKNTDDFSEDI